LTNFGCCAKALYAGDGSFDSVLREPAPAECFMTESNDFLVASQDSKRIAGRSIYYDEFY
jgi:hypothetical protein